MKIIISCFILLAALVSCQNELPIIPKNKISVSNENDKSPLDSTKHFAFKGKLELQSFEAKYESKWTKKPTSFPFTNDSIIKVYRLNCPGECPRPEFNNRVSKGIEINRIELEKLVHILSDSKSYDNSTAACYNPGFGLVVYDQEGVPSEFLSICMNCNSARTYPGSFSIEYENEYLYGFSSGARKSLRELFKSWGLDYDGYSSIWDDKAEME